MNRTEWLIARAQRTIADTLREKREGDLLAIAGEVARDLHASGLLRAERDLMPVYRASAE